MKKLLFLFAMFNVCYCQNLNYAPKIINPEEEKSIVIIIPSYNNQRFYLENLKSVVNQNYKNFRVIYTNDASTDNTGELVQDYMANHFDLDRFTYVENSENMGALHNIYHMVHSCRDDEIVCLLDGDDKLANKDVLKRLNQAYADDHVWMTYGLDYCRIKKKGHSRPTETKILKEGKHRKIRYRWSHLRTYYAGLFKHIPKEKWMHKGKFYPVAWDIAIILYLFDLAREHVYFIPEVLYIYNVDNPINDYKIYLRQQIWYRKYIWALPPVERLYNKKDFIHSL